MAMKNDDKEISFVVFDGFYELNSFRVGLKNVVLPTVWFWLPPRVLGFLGVTLTKSIVLINVYLLLCF